MNKLAVFAVSALTAFVSWCGYLAYHNEVNPNDQWGVFWRTRDPTPVAPAAIRQEQAMLAAASIKADAALQINGKRIVRIDPERHDMAHALARAERASTR